MAPLKMPERKPLAIKDEDEYNDDEFEVPEPKKKEEIPIDKAIMPQAPSRLNNVGSAAMQPVKAAHQAAEIKSNSLKSASIQSEVPSHKEPSKD